MEIRLQNIKLEDLSSVARIHLIAFPDSVLTWLGTETVRRYYKWQLMGSHDVVAIGAFKDGRFAPV